MKPFFLMLYGYPAAGKYTIAKEVAASSNARLIDNHLINNPIFQVVRSDGKSSFSEDVWFYVGKIRALVFDCIMQLAQPNDSFIFTNVLLEETKDDGDRLLLKKIQEMAEDKQALFVPVRLECDLVAAKARVTAPEREARTKLTDADALVDIYKNTKLLNADHPNLLTLDTSRLPPKDAAAAILAHIAQL